LILILTDQVDIFGHNIQWRDTGDGIWLNPYEDYNGTINYNPWVKTAITQLKVPIIRYPGGTLSEVYKWENGISFTMRLLNQRNGTSKYSWILH
jgi:alpha-N-arabinofuranosidase